MGKFRVNLSELEYLCTLPTQDFFTDNPLYHFIPAYPSAKILAVAHVDTVRDDGYTRQSTATFERIKYLGVPAVQSLALDDRLGLYLLTELRKVYPLDLLLTRDEEHGASTITTTPLDFESYNWILELDYREVGCAALYHGYNSGVWDFHLTAANLKPVHGSYSDIASLYDHSIASVNLSCGYRLAHSDKCFATLPDITRCYHAALRLLRLSGQAKLRYELPEPLDIDEDDTGWDDDNPDYINWKDGGW